MATAKPKLTGDYKLLLHVPKTAILNVLFSETKDYPPVDKAYKSLTKDTRDFTREIGRGLSTADLAQILELSAIAVKPKKIFEEHRYSGMKSFFLHEWESRPDLTSFDMTALNAAIKEREDLYKKDKYELKFKGIEITGIEKLTSYRSPIYELSYKYVTSIHYINPKDAYPDSVEDLRFGLVWLAEQADWFAVCARDEIINHIITHGLEKVFGLTSKKLLITKTVIKEFEPDYNLRRATHHDPRTGTTRRIRNKKLQDDLVSFEEVKRLDETNDRPSSGYNEQVNGFELALGYSNEKGKLFFSKDLPASVLREWGARKIDQLFETVQRIRATRPQLLIASQALPALRIVQPKAKDSVIELCNTLYACKKNHSSEEPLTKDALTLAAELEKLITPRFLVNCEECGDYSELSCGGKCDSLDFEIQGHDIVCKKCGKKVQKTHVHCHDGHTNPVAELSDVVHLICNPPLARGIFETVKECAKQDYNINEEFFYIRGSIFVHFVASTKTVYTLNEIPELNALLMPGLKPKAKGDILVALGGFKEKCKKHSKGACANCTNITGSHKCYMRAFAYFDSDFIPRPHEGHEYGDYRRRVTIDGARDQQLLIMFKSKKDTPSDADEIKMRDTIGSDIYTQLRRYLAKSDVAIIGVCVPRRLDAEFQSMLRQDSWLHRKKLIFIDHEDLCEVVWSAMKNNNIPLTAI